MGRYGEITHNREDNGKFKIPFSTQFSVHSTLYAWWKIPYSLKKFYFFIQNKFIRAEHRFQKCTARNHGLTLSSDEQKKIVAFSEKTMSDSVFIHDPKYCNPFLDWIFRAWLIKWNPTCSEILLQTNFNCFLIVNNCYRIGYMFFPIFFINPLQARVSGCSFTKQNSLFIKIIIF